MDALGDAQQLVERCAPPCNVQQLVAALERQPDTRRLCPCLCEQTQPALLPHPVQESRLTSLAISGQVPTDIPAFFGSLACLTGLRSLSLSSMNPATMLNRLVTGGMQWLLLC